MLVLTMAWLYYRHREQRRNDKWILHVAICINLVSDALGTIAICASVYLVRVESDRSLETSLMAELILMQSSW